ncbi:unnamed protein product [Oncorhynchus mykiss]|uniref:Uncharacterized protein n=1 Tax=Oncorhynchus mykiss TaxID=8022 RepID=A0A060Y080_ONCMY|nr:unnamed protein product [Oncorhynchus mykiss]
MAVPFKIPKRKQPSEADNMHMQSPLSRLRDTSSPFETSWCNGSSNGKRPEQVGSLNGHIPRAGKQSTPNRLLLRDVCEARLGPGQSDKWTSSQSTGFQRPAQTPEHHPPSRTPHIQSSPVTSSSTHKAEQRLPAASPPCFKNGWRPKRASDTLCRDKNQETGCVSPLLKTRRAEFSGQCHTHTTHHTERESVCVFEYVCVCVFEDVCVSSRALKVLTRKRP